jgi:hypothetical protein
MASLTRKDASDTGGIKICGNVHAGSLLQRDAPAAFHKS